MPYASNMRPVDGLNMYNKKNWREPMRAMGDDDVDGRSVDW